MAPTIVLEVEGVLYKTSLSTLTSVKGSYVNRLFQTDWKDRLDNRGRLFIDRDSTIFPLILNYLRDGSIPLPRDEYYLERIFREAKFFNLYNLCLDVEKKIKQVNSKRHGRLPRINMNAGNVSPSISIRSEATFDVGRKLPCSPRGSLDGSLPEEPIVPTRRRGKQKKLAHSTVHLIIDAAKKQILVLFTTLWATVMETIEATLLKSCWPSP